MKSSSKRPVTPNNEYQNESSPAHWSERIYECSVSIAANGILNLQIDGGSDNGEFAYFGHLDQSRINYAVKGGNYFQPEDLILEIQNQKVAGYTQRDIVAWLNHCCRRGNPVNIVAVRSGYLTRDLRQYLNSRFQKGSLDHDLQNTIRDNLYLRTVPCTTRVAREGEVNGVDYAFLSAEEFIALEKSGNLLESGIYEGNHYGTPKPPRDAALHSLQRGVGSPGDEGVGGTGVILPGAHPSSEGKRRRNRSNVEAMAAKSTDIPQDSPLMAAVNSRSSTPQSSIVMRSRRPSGDVPSDYSLDLGPLPDNWEKAYTETGEAYFVDHNSGNSQWLDPRLARVQKKSIEECEDDELPYGWERIDDPHYGTYYIDHVNRRTQYENPVIQAKRAANHSQPEFSNGGNFWYVRDSDPNGVPTMMMSSNHKTNNGVGEAPPLLPHNGGGSGSGGSNNRERDVRTPSRNGNREYYGNSAEEALWNNTPTRGDNRGGGILTTATTTSNEYLNSNNNNNNEFEEDGVHRNKGGSLVGGNNSNGDPLVNNTNSESHLISSSPLTSSPDYPLLEPNNGANGSAVTQQQQQHPPSSSPSPDTSPRFPYLPCIPCLNEKPDGHHHPNHHQHQHQRNATKSPRPHSEERQKTPSESPQNHILSNGGPLAHSGGIDSPGDHYGRSPDVRGVSLLPPASRMTRSRSEPRNTKIGGKTFDPLYGQTGNVSGGASSVGPANRYRAYQFSRDPSKLEGEIISTLLLKSSRGLGFTIVGGDDAGSEEFLQIKSVVPNSPAWNDGKLKTGDVLVYVNGTCVLGFSHQDMVSLFQSIPPDETVHLEACRGYPLPFDPEDPNNEIVTTLAVNSEEGAGDEAPLYGTSGDRRATNEEGREAMGRAAKSMPDLSARRSTTDTASRVSLPQRRNSADLLSASDNTPDILDFNPQSSSKPEYLTVEIVKGTAGFGFTIADSAYGQKVKKILDRQRCDSLQEGDILVKINQLDLRGLTHADVVQVLKDCPCGDAAQITLQRGGSLSPTKNRPKNAKSKALDASLKSSGSLSRSFHLTDEASFLPPLRGAYRSKTPTADLYSSREKEAVSFARPKTPLVDARNWARSTNQAPSSQHHHSLNKSNGFLTTSTTDNLGGSVGDGGSTTNFYNHSKTLYGVGGVGGAEESGLFTLPGGGLSSEVGGGNGDDMDQENLWANAELARTKEYPWLSRSFRDTRTLTRDRHSGFNPRNSDSKLRELYDKDDRRLFNGNSLLYDDGGGAQHRLPQRRFDAAPAPDDWRRNHHLDASASSNYAYPEKTPPWLPDRGNYESARGMASKASPRMNNGVPAPFYTSNYYNGGGQQQHSFANYDPTSNNNNAQQAINHFQGAESSSGYYTSAAISPHPSNAGSQSLSGSQYDSLTRRKHSTSFEHEQPVTSSSSSMAHLKERDVLDSRFQQHSPSTFHQNEHQRGLLSSPSGGPGLAPSSSSGAGHSSVGVIEMTVTLLRQESGFGFRIVGGTEEGSQVAIGHIVAGGAADLDSRLRTGDEIVSVDGASVLNTSHHHVVQLMGLAARNGKVVLAIRRKVPNLSDSLSKSGDGIFPYDVTVTRHENEGFGFVIISSVTRVGSTIGRIIEGSPAERCNRLRVGDRILAVNGVSILNTHHGEIVNLIKDSGFSVTLTIGAPQGDDASSSASVSQRGDDQSMEQDDHYYAVELHRGLRGFGFSIRGGREFHNMPLFVLRIAEGGPAHQDTRLQVGDQIIEINGINTKNMAHSEAIEIIKRGGARVRLLIKRGNKMSLALVEQASPVTPTGSLGTPLSAGSSITNGPICQSSPRDVASPNNTNYEIPRDLWNYEPR